MEEEFTHHKGVGALASCVEVVETVEEGRHLVASRDIQVGEVVGREVAAGVVPLPSTLTTHCSSCLVGVGARLLPCPSCPAVFCSLVCMGRAGAGHAAVCAIEQDMGEVVEQIAGSPCHYYTLALALLAPYTMDQVPLVLPLTLCSQAARIQRGEVVAGEEGEGGLGEVVVGEEGEGRLGEVLTLVSNDDQRSLTSDFWIFLLATGMLRVMLEREGREQTEGRKRGRLEGGLDEEGAAVGALLVRLIRVGHVYSILVRSLVLQIQLQNL